MAPMTIAPTPPIDWAEAALAGAELEPAALSTGKYSWGSEGHFANRSIAKRDSRAGLGTRGRDGAGSGPGSGSGTSGAADDGRGRGSDRRSATSKDHDKAVSFGMIDF